MQFSSDGGCCGFVVVVVVVAFATVPLLLLLLLLLEDIKVEGAPVDIGDVVVTVFATVLLDIVMAPVDVDVGVGVVVVGCLVVEDETATVGATSRRQRTCPVCRCSHLGSSSGFRLRSLSRDILKSPPMERQVSFSWTW